MVMMDKLYPLLRIDFSRAYVEGSCVFRPSGMFCCLAWLVAVVYVSAARLALCRPVPRPARFFSAVLPPVRPFCKETRKISVCFEKSPQKVWRFGR